MGRTSQIFAPNASTDRVRPKSSLSSYGTDGAMDEDDEPATAATWAAGEDSATPTPRRTAYGRVSDVGIGIAGLGAGTGKRLSVSRLPAPSGGGGRLSFGVRDRGSGEERPGSSRSNTSGLDGVGELADDDETF